MAKCKENVKKDMTTNKYFKTIQGYYLTFI